MQNQVCNIVLPESVQDILSSGTDYLIPESREQLFTLALGGEGRVTYDVEYNVPGKGHVVEATVVKCKNGLSVNYPEPYMRRRDPDCMVIADHRPTDKPRYRDLYGEEFSSAREQTFDWLKKQKLIVMPFMAGGMKLGYPALMVAPANAAFFAAALGDLQGFIPRDKIPEDFVPRAVVYVAPVFRHTLFHGKQVVVHNRLEGLHELFSYNLYPGPSAKKGIYGVLLNIGEQEGWLTAHASVVRVITPYENIITVMHEAASGGGKSEMCEKIHKEMDGRIVLARNIVTQEKTYLELKEECDLQPVADDMALCHPKLQTHKGKLRVQDAENSWFLRVDNITHYGTDPMYERLCIHPPKPLIFLNLQGVPGATCLIWEHTLDAPGKPCKNPRVIMPRSFVPNVYSEPVTIDVRSFGVRVPPCTREKPTYGIMGIFHILSPSLAWLWRLVAPRGYANPSIIDSDGMASEGVGSYWPFATGRMVDQANLLLRQICAAANTRYILIPNQHIGAYQTGFMPEWVTREYLARRGTAKFRRDQIRPSRCSLLGYSLESLKVDGTFLPKGLLQTNLQPEVGAEGYDAGAKILTAFFKEQLNKYRVADLDPLGKKIIECFMDGGGIDDYAELIPARIS